MKNVVILLLNLLGSCVAIPVNSKEGESLNSNKENLVDVVLLLDQKDSMRQMFAKPLAENENEESEKDSEIGTNELGG